MIVQTRSFLGHFNQIVEPVENWCEKNCIGEWEFGSLLRTLSDDDNYSMWRVNIHFQDKNDAIRFKLFWG